jgi:hypothetical protein
MEVSLDTLKVADNLEGEDDIPPESDDELITATNLPADCSPTPRPASKLTPRAFKSPAARKPAWSWIAVAAGLAVVTGLLAATVLALVLK